MAIRTALAAFSVAFLAGTGASALCPTPTEIGNTDTVLQFQNRSAGGSQGAMGTKSELNARLPGTLYYSHSSKGLKLCDGTNWVGIADSGAGSSGGTFAVGAIWSKSFAEGEQANIPLESEGKYEMSVYLKSTRGGCYAQYKRPNGTYSNIAYASETGGDDEVADLKYNIYGMGGNSYRYSLTFHDKVQGPRDTGTIYWDDIGSVNWTGGMKHGWSGSDHSCTMTVKILRYE